MFNLVITMMNLEEALNSLNQTGPIGKLVSASIPENMMDIIESGDVTLMIDDNRTGAGDGFAVDFVRILVNPYFIR